MLEQRQSHVVDGHAARRLAFGLTPMGVAMCTGFASARGVYEPIGSAARSNGPSVSPISLKCS